MKNKIFIFVGVFVLIFLIIGSFFFVFGSENRKVVKQKNVNLEVEKYGSENISEDCRIPESGYDVESWKQHLSHHEPTWYCLEYYGTSIEELNKNK